jgi:translation initiation factor IF-1
MAHEGAWEVAAKIIEVLSERLYRAELANGHRFLAHVGKKGRLTLKVMLPGDSIKVRMSPYDLSKARILAAEK